MSATATEKESKEAEKSKPSMDPFMAKLGESFNRTIELDAGGEVKLKPMAPVDLKEEPAPPAHATQTVGEMVVERARVEEAGKEQEKEPEKKEEKAEHRTSNQEEQGKEEVKPAADAAKDEAKTAQVKVKARKVEPVTMQQQAPLAVAPVPEKKEELSAGTPKETRETRRPGHDLLPVPDDYEKGLSDGQREELDLARAAEKFLPEQYRGQSVKLIGFFKKVDEFASGHPELAPESEEFKEFVERSRPVYREGDRRRVERMQIKAEVTESTRKEMEETLAKTTGEIKRRQYELEVKPVVAKTLENFQDGLLSELPQGVDESLAEVGKVMQEEGFEAAAAKFPVEAPIYESTVRAASEYLELLHGLKVFNEQDGTHRWLVTFIDRQAEVIKGDAERRMDKGKEFLAPNEYVELAQKDAQAARKHWTFSEQQILDMLALNAHMAATNRIKELESAGYRREKKAEKKAETLNLEPRTLNLEQAEKKAESSLNGKSGEEKNSEETNGTVSPRAGTTGVTGVATGKPNVSETGRFMELLVPGGGKFAG